LTVILGNLPAVGIPLIEVLELDLKHPSLQGIQATIDASHCGVIRLLSLAMVFELPDALG